jgi:citrate lyase subunit beta/citryl-CoA lyase
MRNKPPLQAGHHGPTIRNDCHVTIDPSSSGIHIESTVASLYGDRIEACAKDALNELGLRDVGVTILDSGALDFCIRARIEAAALPLAGRRLAVPLKQVPVVPRARRTRLYLPGNTPKFFANAGLHGADSLIFDLEDSVPLSEKHEARALVRHAAATLDLGCCEIMSRPNRGEEGELDLEAIRGCGVETLLVPKVTGADELDVFGDEWTLVPLIEDPLGMERAFEIASHDQVSAMALGVEDYCTAMQASRTETLVRAFAYLRLVNACRAAGKSPLGSVYADIDDLEGFEKEVRWLAGLGLEGVGCLHPKQVAVAARALRPTAEVQAWAEKILAASSEQDGAQSVDGQMVDAPIVARALKILEQVGEKTWRESS